MSTEANDKPCPRCGAEFHCGANDPQPCPCGALTLTEASLRALRDRYTTCVCLNCLRQLRDIAAPSGEQHSAN